MATAIEASHTMQMRITQISQLESVSSSEVFIYGIPWKVEILKSDGGENDQPSLDVFLHYNAEDALDQSISGTFSCKLFPFRPYA